MEKIIEKFRLHEKDVGSAAVQIINCTKRILSIAEHVKAHKKDKHCRVGVVRLVNQRKSFMSYLKRKSETQYRNLIKELGLRG